MKLSASKPRELEMGDLTGRRGPGALTRRSALPALSATMVSPDLVAQQTRPVIRTRRLNNVRIAVSDLARSTAFYERLFGPPVRQDGAVRFPIGEGFFALTTVTGGAKADFLSYGMTVADFDAERVMRTPYIPVIDKSKREDGRSRARPYTPMLNCFYAG
jgi:hypothetical protein